MKTVINLFHPNLDQSRVNAALVSGVGDLAEVRNEYALYPDFQIDVKSEQAVLEGADRIVLQFPMYWYSSPALLKQWEDLVLTHGWAYGTGGDALHGKELLVAVTVGGDKYGHDKEARYEVNELLRPFQAMSRLVGLTYLTPFKVMGASSISDDALASEVARYQKWLAADDLKSLGDFD